MNSQARESILRRVRAVLRGDVLLLTQDELSERIAAAERAANRAGYTEGLREASRAISRVPRRPYA